MDDLQAEKQSLIDQKNSGDALREVQLHHGWKEVATILSEMYKENVISLIEKDNVEARATLKVIEQLSSELKTKIDYAKVAAEELKSARFNLTQATPE